MPIFEKDEKGLFHNSAVVINTDGKLMNTYRKIHIPQDPGFYEKEYFDTMTDGQLGDYNDFIRKGGKLDNIDDWSGR